jgi:hypothetical protein
MACYVGGGRLLNQNREVNNLVDRPKTFSVHFRPENPAFTAQVGKSVHSNHRDLLRIFHIWQAVMYVTIVSQM